MNDYLLYEMTHWWNIPLLIITIVLALLYLIITKKYTTGKKRFLLALLILYLCLGSPIYGLGHLLFSVHMTQMAVLCFFVPPLLIMGVPADMIKHRYILSFSKLLKRPMIIMVLFSGLFAFYHIPIVFDTVMTSPILYIGYHALLMITALGMWSPLVSPLSQYLPKEKRKQYMYWSGAIILPACLLMVFAVQPLYKSFHDPATWQAALDACFGLDHMEDMKKSLGLLPTMTDQRLGGVIMLALHKLSHYVGAR